jgi:hypothetical protein
MFRLISRCKSVFICMTVLAALMALPLDLALAAIIDTQASQREQNPGDFRVGVMTLLAREEVKIVLLQHGINPVEVEARAAAMTDDEIATVANTIKDMPAGGLANTWAGFALFILGLGIIAVIVFALLIWGGVELYSKHSPKDASTSTVE